MSDYMRPYTSAHVHVNYTQILYTSKATDELLTAVQQNGMCDKVILSVGQWSASYIGGRPALYRQYRKGMSAMLRRVLKYYPRESVFVRSMHYLPVMKTTAVCPPEDWRTPPVIDGYNSIVRSLTEELEIGFIDTKFMMEPMWDSSEDWNHYLNKAGDYETLYVAAKVLEVLS